MADSGNNDNELPAQNISENAPRVSRHTLPVEEQHRLKKDEIRIELCNIDDMPLIAEQLYTCFPDSFWDKMEPPSIRADTATRTRRLGTRLSPSVHLSEMKWIKAVYVPTGKVVGVAGWMLPGMPIHNVWRRSATRFYDFQSLMGWSDADVEELWDGVDLDAWDGHIGRNDVLRAEVMGKEPHWFLAPLMTVPEFQGKGVASRLMGWAIERADARGEAMYLESAPTARKVYERFGFEPVGETGFVRWGSARSEGRGGSG